MKQLLRKIIPAGIRPVRYLENLVYDGSNSRVMDGPFRGMKYIRKSTGSALIPKLLGIYERELNGAVEELGAMDFDQIIDIGAAEGYYATGFALRCKSSKVFAYEMEASGRENLSEMLKLNEVSDRVEIRGKCEAKDIQEFGAGDASFLVVCDVEGYEDLLLDPAKAEVLRKAYILVELHEFLDRGISDRLRKRFEATHEIEEIWQEERSISDFPFSTLYTKLLPKSYLEWAVSEWRPERMNWFYMKPKSD